MVIIIIIIIMVLARSRLEQSGVMYPSLVYMTLGVPKHVLDVVLTGGVRFALSIRPTRFAEAEI